MMQDSTKSTSQAVVELLDVSSVAELCGCSTRHVYRLSDSCRMPRPIKLGRLVRWRRADLDAWIATGCPEQEAGGQCRVR